MNLRLNTQKHHYRSQRTLKWIIILAHDSCPIHHAPSYIAVPLLGPHQPRNIEYTVIGNFNQSHALFNYEMAAQPARPSGLFIFSTHQ